MRRALPLTALLLLSGCGFHPLYGPGPKTASMTSQMDQIDIGLIPDRSGQLLREALEANLQGRSDPAFYRYHLGVQYGISVQAIGIQPDSSNSRLRYFATASWTLTPEGNLATPLVKGNAQAVDSLNVIDNQFFALSLQGNQVQHVLARELATQISQELAIYFRKHPGNP